MTSRRLEADHPPRALVVVACLVLLATVTMAFLGAHETGKSWDESYHLQRLQNYHAHGWFVSDNELVGDAPGTWASTRYVYGPVAMLLIQGWAELVGGGTGAGTDAASFALRHQAVVLLSLVCLAAVAAIGALVLRSWRWGLVAAAVTASFPLWTGQSMFNVKDVPVATGYTLATLGFVLAGRPSPSRRAWFLSCCSLVAGIVLSMGTRPGIAPGLAAGALVLLAFAGWRDRVQGLPVARRLAGRLAVLGASVAMAWLVLVAVYPRVFANPFATLGVAAESSSQVRDAPKVPLYLPLHLILDPPITLVLLFTAGVVLFLVRLRAMRWEGDELVGLALVGAQAGAVPLAAVLTSAYLYNGLRQILFVIPALAVLATYAVVVVLRRASSARRAASTVVTVVTAVALAVPLVGQVGLFPYNYTYRGVLYQAFGVWMETDYWRTSVRELAQDLPDNGRVICSPYYLDGKAQRYGFDGSNDCVTDPVGPLAPYTDAQPSGGATLPDDEFYIVAVLGSNPRNCKRLADVSRPLLWTHLMMGWVARCRLPFPELDARRLRLTHAPHLWRDLYDGWSPRPEGVGAAMTGEAATLRFVLAPDLVGRALRLTLQVEDAPGLSLTWDDEQLPLVRSGGTTVVAEVPPTRTRDVSLTLRSSQPRALLSSLDIRARAAR